MLRNNLSTRPFYNDRAVRAGLMSLTALTLGLMLFNAYEILRLRAQDSAARQMIAENDAQARQLREQAQTIGRSIDQARLTAVQLAAGEANALIDRRTFSWTELLNQFQATLPPDVRIAGVAPGASEGRMQVQISVLSRRIEDLEEFMDALAKTGVFSSVLSRSDRPEDGTLRSELEAFYSPTAPPSPEASAGQAVPPAPASEAGKRPAVPQGPSGNTTPEAPR